MRIYPIFAAGILLLAISGEVGAAPLSSPGLSQSVPSSVQLVQAKNDETLKQKVKRVWRNIAGTTYNVGCPSLAVAFTRSTCTETGKDAQAKCIARNPFCQVSEKR